MAGHFRAYPRRPTNPPLPAKIAGSEAPVQVVDLAIGGAGLRAEIVLEPGARIDLVLSIPNRWDPLVLPSRVAWSNGTRAGLAFEPKTDAETWALFELLASQTFEG